MVEFPHFTAASASAIRIHMLKYEIQGNSQSFQYCSIFRLRFQNYYMIQRSWLLHMLFHQLDSLISHVCSLMPCQERNACCVLDCGYLMDPYGAMRYMESFRLESLKVVNVGTWLALWACLIKAGQSVLCLPWGPSLSFGRT